MKQNLHILHIEDSAEDSELICRLLAHEGIQCEVKRIETRAALFTALESDSFDLILSDCKLPNFSGLHALEIAHALKPEIPFVFVSGTIGEETAIESLRNGAVDYVLKDRLSRLVPAVRRALAEAEEKVLCRQLQHRLREAGRLEAISTLSNGIAHDFNNILTIILGHASLLNKERDNPQRIDEISNTITQAGQRGAEVVQQLLAFARKSDGQATPVDLNSFIQEKIELLKQKLPAHIAMTFSPGRELPSIMADASQLERILVNILTNAADSMSTGGRLTLSTELIPATHVPSLLPGLALGHYVCLKVTDTGSGMDITTREHAFEPFYTTKERGRGTGLGLPVVYGLMQAQNGFIDVQSEPGEGTTVSLFFPVAQNDRAQTTGLAHLLEDSLRGSETILVVEDEQDVCFFLETILQNHGYQVLTAHNAKEGLAIFKDHQDKIQLVFSDIGLPKVDGIVLCQELKKLNPDLPIILASGYPTKEFKTRLQEINPEGFLSKPYKSADILQTLRQVLDHA